MIFKDTVSVRHPTKTTQWNMFSNSLLCGTHEDQGSPIQILQDIIFKGELGVHVKIERHHDCRDGCRNGRHGNRKRQVRIEHGTPPIRVASSWRRCNDQQCDPRCTIQTKGNDSPKSNQWHNQKLHNQASQYGFLVAYLLLELIDIHCRRHPEDQAEQEHDAHPFDYRIPVHDDDFHLNEHYSVSRSRCGCGTLIAMVMRLLRRACFVWCWMLDSLVDRRRCCDRRRIKKMEREKSWWAGSPSIRGISRPIRSRKTSKPFFPKCPFLSLLSRTRLAKLTVNGYSRTFACHEDNHL